MHEVNFLRRRDSTRSKSIKFTDIAHPDYDPGQNGNVSYEEGMKKIYAVKSNGDVVSGKLIALAKVN